MKKHGLSHAIGAFVSTISSVALSNLIKDTMPDLYAVLFAFSGLIKNVVPLSERVIGYAVLASILMFFWGIGFYLVHKD